MQSDDIGPGAQVKVLDITAGAVNSAKVANGSLNDEDVGSAYVNFAINVGTVDGHACRQLPITL